MRDYFRRASELHQVCRAFMRVHLQTPARRFFPGLSLRRKPSKGFEVRSGELFLRGGGSSLHGGAGHVMEAFRVAQEAGVGLSDDLKSAIHERTRQIGRAFRSSREACSVFLRLLHRRGRVGPALRAMHETGVLGCLVPEWARITFLVQHDYFHKYTVDEHTLKAIDALDEVAAGDDPALAPLGRLFDELEDVFPVYLGMLLHDIGKGRGNGHVGLGVEISRRILGRLRLAPEVVEKVLFLVGAHLEMSQISQHRDLTEASLIDAFATRVGSLEKLNLLLLLTYADHRGVGPGIWNEWKASLLWELYTRVRPRLMGGELRPGQGEDERAASARARAFETLEAEGTVEDVERHLAGLPERYFRATSPTRCVRHFRLVSSRGASPMACDWHDLGDGRGTELTVTADDRPGLFATLAGTLTASGIDILSVDLFTRVDGVALDTFHIAELPGHSPVRPDRRSRLELALADAVAGRLDVARAVERWRSKVTRRARRHLGRTARPPSVRFDQEASAVATVVEVKAQDEPGLLYGIAYTLTGLGLDITFARIATAKALALDVFYVRGQDGGKLEEAAMAEVEQALLAALGGRSRARTNG
jgi:[protein-PII] uridylyltransferase